MVAGDSGRMRQEGRRRAANQRPNRLAKLASSAPDTNGLIFALVSFSLLISCKFFHESINKEREDEKKSSERLEV